MQGILYIVTISLSCSYLKDSINVNAPQARIEANTVWGALHGNVFFSRSKILLVRIWQESKGSVDDWDVLFLFALHFIMCSGFLRSTQFLKT